MSSAISSGRDQDVDIVRYSLACPELRSRLQDRRELIPGRAEGHSDRSPTTAAVSHVVSSANRAGVVYLDVYDYSHDLANSRTDRQRIGSPTN